MAKMIDEQIKSNILDFRAGDEVIVEMLAGKDKKRLQAFQGLVQFTHRDHRPGLKVFADGLFPHFLLG